MESSNLSLSIVEDQLTLFLHHHNVPAQEPIYVALSGGLDSCVLLHALSRRYDLTAITAVHIHHGLQTAGDEFMQHCRTFCQQLGVKLICEQVCVDKGASLEHQARMARFAAFVRLLPAGAMLFLGQQQDEQIETFFLRLLRGAGLQGLSSMQSMQPFETLLLARPFLALSKTQLQQYAQTQQIQWQEDPSNQDTQFKRNLLRHKVLPHLYAYDVQAQANISRSISQLQQDYQSLLQLLSPHYAACVCASQYPYTGAQALALTPLRQHNEQVQHLIVRHWLSRLGLYAPNLQQLTEIQRTVIAAKADAMPEYHYQKGVLMRHQQHLYWVLPQILPKPQSLCLKTTANAELGHWGAWKLTASKQGNLRLGQYQLVAAGSITIRKLEVVQRGHKTFKQLFQEAHIPSWLRPSYPVLLEHNQPVALLGLALDKRVYCAKNEGVSLNIDFHPAHSDEF